MSVTQRPRDEGTAYEMRKSAFKADLVQVGRGTPMGELLRAAIGTRLGLSGDANGIPRKVRATRRRSGSLP